MRWGGTAAAFSAFLDAESAFYDLPEGKQPCDQLWLEVEAAAARVSAAFGEATRAINHGLSVDVMVLAERRWLTKLLSGEAVA